MARTLDQLLTLLLLDHAEVQGERRRTGVTRGAPGITLCQPRKNYAFRVLNLEFATMKETA